MPKRKLKEKIECECGRKFFPVTFGGLKPVEGWDNKKCKGCNWKTIGLRSNTRGGDRE